MKIKNLLKIFIKSQILLMINFDRLIKKIVKDRNLFHENDSEWFNNLKESYFLKNKIITDWIMKSYIKNVGIGIKLFYLVTRKFVGFDFLQMESIGSNLIEMSKCNVRVTNVFFFYQFLHFFFCSTILYYSIFKFKYSRLVI